MKKTVKQRIFRINTLFVLTAIAVLLAINAIVAKVYIETIEKDWKNSVENVVSETQMKTMLKDWTVQRQSFVWLFVLDAALCILAVALVGWIFTKKLEQRIMEPLAKLSGGAERVREGRLTEKIEYEGEVEFEEVCGTFNAMQSAIAQERLKNERYEKGRSDMIAGISHDIRTPLTAVQGSLQAILDGVAETPEMQEKFLQTAVRRTGEMDELLGQLLLVSRIERGKMQIQKQKIPILSFVSKYVAQKQEEFPEIMWNWKKQENELFICADEELLVRIFDNLVENSRKYAEVENLQMTFDVKDGENDIEIFVKDNGQGISQEKLPFVFEEFYRGDDARSGAKGSGLGLYIVKSLVEAMDGSVRADNADGFRVCITLPRAKEDENGR